MTYTITLPLTGPAVTPSGTIPRSNVAVGIWRAVNHHGAVKFVRALKGSRCSPACAAANPETWTTCSCACGGAHHGGGDHGVLFEIDPEAQTATVLVDRSNVRRVTGLESWESRLSSGVRVEYTGEFRPSEDGYSDLATVVSVQGSDVEIRWDHSGEVETVGSHNLVRVTSESVA